MKAIMAKIFDAKIIQSQIQPELVGDPRELFQS